ncbi:MAG: hypothetical protein WCF67_11635 [Chitinophagaceae bacterium]
MFNSRNNILKDNAGLILTGVIVVWYLIAAGIDYLWLSGTKFSNLIFLQKAYLGMKPIGLPLPETGILLFLLGLIPVIIIFILLEKKIPRKQTFRYILGVIGVSFAIFFLLIPILVAGEVAYIVLIDKFCTWVSWLTWIKDVTDLFTFEADIQTSVIKNPITVDMSLGGFLALYIGIPRIRKKLNV